MEAPPSIEATPQPRIARPLRRQLRPALALVVFIAGCGQPHPSDATFLEEFRANRAELELLVAMFQHDKGLGQVGDHFTRPEDPAVVGITPKRIDEYRRLCRSVGAPDCIEGYDSAYDLLYGAPIDFGLDKDPIWIHVSAVGLSISGSSKGYLYSEDPDFPVVEDLDAIKVSKSGTWLRHIEGFWYVYYDYED